MGLFDSLYSHWRRQWQPTPVLLPGKSHGWRSLVGYSPWGWEESDMTEPLHFHFSLSCIGEGNGNLLQCSCLENPRDGGAWWAAVYGVAQSRTRLKRLSSSFIFFLSKGEDQYFAALVSLITTREYALVSEACCLSSSRVHSRCKKFDHSLFFPPLGSVITSFLPSTPSSHSSQMMPIHAVKPIGEPWTG